jgi:hypothetical protein
MSDELAARTHECPAPGCVKRVPRHQFACPVDWVRLPPEMRREINSTYRRDWGAHIKAMHAAIDWYGQHAGATS